MSRRSLSRLLAAVLSVSVLGILLAIRETGPSVQAQAQGAKAEEAGSGFVVDPYLQSMTQNSVIIMCETPTPTDCTIDYGHATPGESKANSAAPQTLHAVTLDKLEPNKRYFYKVTCRDSAGGAITSKVLSFGTASGPEDAWSFAVIGDTQRNPTVTGLVGSKIWNRRPNMIIHCGDVVDAGADKNQYVKDLFRPCAELFGRVPLFPCIGNHEKNHANYYNYFSLPKPEYYYSYRYGNAEFFSIDTNKSVAPGSEQYEWLDKALAASKATWKFCYHHHPAYSSDSNDYGDTFKTYPTKEGDLNARKLVELYEKHKIDICFNGHIHVYERTWPIRGNKIDKANGIYYITSGGGGGSLEDFSPTPAFFKAEFRSDYHYCYLTLHGGALHFKAFDKDDRLFDQFSLEKSNGR